MAAAIGVRHRRWEEPPLLIVVPRQGRTPARDSVLAHLAQHFAKWQLSDDVVLAEPSRSLQPERSTRSDYESSTAIT
jgi:acyl-CoA synthetase (AMP-forming)/AMP-acid ligase II